MIVAQPLPETAFEVQETEQMLVLTTSALEIQVQKATAALTYRDRQGHLLTREPEQGGKTLTPTPVLRSLFDEVTERIAIEGVDDARMKVEGVRQVIDRQAYHTRLDFV